MVFQEMVPWKRGRQSGLLRDGSEGFPLGSLQRRMNRMFDDFFGDFGDISPSASRFLNREGVAFIPRIDVSDSEKETVVTAELAGIDEKDVDITLQDGVLTIRGDKKVERDEKEECYCLIERSCGTFSRSLALPAEVEQDKIKASFKNGVLTVRLPKLPAEESKAKKIEIEHES